MTDPQSFTIIGAGAIGAIVGVHLIRAGHDVTFVEANTDHVAAIREHGLRLTGALEMTVHPTIFEPHEIEGTHSQVFLAVKSSYTKNALAPMAPHLDPDGYVLSLQNGLEEYKIIDMVGESRTIGAFLTFGGFYEGPGEVKFAGTGSFRVGEVNGRASQRVEELSQILSALQPVEVTDNIFGYLWAKMALGAVYFATATVSADVPEIYDRGIYLEVLGNLAGEVARVANGAGVVPEVIDGFDPKVFSLDEPTDPEKAAANWEAQKKYWGVLSHPRTGVWRDLAVHRRKTEVDELVGSVMRAAAEKQIATPRVDALVSIVHDIESGKRELGWHNLDALAAVNDSLDEIQPAGRIGT